MQSDPYHMKKHTLYTLSLIEFFERFGFFGIVSSLVLYLIHHFNLNMILSYDYYGIFLALALFLPICGGFIADHWLLRSKTIQLGVLFYFIGCCVIACAHQLTLFLVGIALYLSGIMLSKSNCSSAIGCLYADDPEQREKAFRFFYAMFNLGATIGPIVFGLCAYWFSWRTGFIVSATGNFIALLMVLKRRKGLKHSDAPQAKESSFISGLLILFVVIIALCSFLFNNLFNIGFSIFYAVILVIFGVRFIKDTRRNQKHLIAIYIMCFFSVCFFSASLQVGSSLTIYLKKFIQPTIFNWPIPIPLLTALDPFFVFATAPFFSYWWIKRRKNKPDISVLTKIAVGLFLVSLSYLIFISVVYLNNHHVHHYLLLLLVLGYLFLGAGEIACTPPLMSAISNYAPKKQKNAILGFWYLTVSLSGYVSGLLSKLATNGSVLYKNQSISHYIHIFWLLIVFSFIMGILALLIRPLFDYLLKE